ncbi:MAG TPA: DUF6134 family protein [Steroidobacteraceae bacterium]|nr:DUF6134 family protein [Steroidobacteraceae bacterium]
MQPLLRSLAAPLAIALWSAGGARAAPDPAAHPTQRWHFRVLLDGKPIGTHDFAVTTAESHLEVDGHARFRVTVLGIPVYRYEHWDQETWQQGCLTRIDARTDDNGHRLSVSGARTASGFALHSSQGDTTLPGCVGTYAYWDRDLLDRTQLLNAQTGRYDPVTVKHLGDGTIRLGNHLVAATHIRIEGGSLHIDVWYRDDDGVWVALESPTQQGRLLRYELDQ